MDKIITVLIAVGILIGVTDTLRGNKWKLGEKFQQGFRLIGSMMISMAGIMTMAPVIALVIKAGGSAAVHQTSYGSFHFEYSAEL